MQVPKGARLFAAAVGLVLAMGCDGEYLPLTPLATTGPSQPTLPDTATVPDGFGAALPQRPCGSQDAALVGHGVALRLPTCNKSAGKPGRIDP